MQGRRKHLKLGGHENLRALFSLRKRGYFLQMEIALHCSLQTLGGTYPLCPRFLCLCFLASPSVTTVKKSDEFTRTLDHRPRGVKAASHQSSPQLVSGLSSVSDTYNSEPIYLNGFHFLYDFQPYITRNSTRLLSHHIYICERLLLKKINKTRQDQE